ncbi:MULTISPECIES: hypothetical protein [Nitrobacteraceae]|uniref:Lipoprotein n=1 Tax=Rhodopseudomonas palustris TaxID=1076 RepID=A0A0D7F0W3_RHOPL|nr:MULTISPECIES: hypothetical protein [Nitrobacteraceae]KIZ46704.1 hypothetical protein OO17_06360 [Rhodopseudomonas palustris]KQW18089.1 hypothetical protein ASC80_21890 [Afipia sp. Root123D2]MCW5703801.1 hypothetical protein [Bradyrhizobium sp.]WOK21054.1 hypothetical protein RBJ75_29145 [Rhodopseudomonas sp. BAL398]
MIRASHILFAPLLIVLAGCAAPAASVADLGPPAPEALFSPERVKPGRLEYAPDRSTFAPLLTERFPYPTQPEANAAYRRLIAAAPSDRSYASSIWLFGCKPGALDEQTARVTRYRGPVVHCATDFLDASGRRLRRETANFYYYGAIWNMQPVYPPRVAAPWRNRERSPQDVWWWVPGRPRYE